MFLFLQVDFGGGGRGHGGLIFLEVSGLDGGFGVSGQSGGNGVRVSQNASLLSALGGGGGGGSGFIVHLEEFSAGSGDLLQNNYFTEY